MRNYVLPGRRGKTLGAVIYIPINVMLCQMNSRLEINITGNATAISVEQFQSGRKKNKEGRIPNRWRHQHLAHSVPRKPIQLDGFRSTA